MNITISPISETFTADEVAAVRKAEDRWTDLETDGERRSWLARIPTTTKLVTEPNPEKRHMKTVAQEMERVNGLLGRTTCPARLVNITLNENGLISSVEFAV